MLAFEPPLWRQYHAGRHHCLRPLGSAPSVGPGRTRLRAECKNPERQRRNPALRRTVMKKRRRFRCLALNGWGAWHPGGCCSKSRLRFCPGRRKSLTLAFERPVDQAIATMNMEQPAAAALGRVPHGQHLICKGVGCQNRVTGGAPAPRRRGDYRQGGLGFVARLARAAPSVLRWRDTALAPVGPAAHAAREPSAGGSVDWGGAQRPAEIRRPCGAASVAQPRRWAAIPRCFAVAIGKARCFTRCHPRSMPCTADSSRLSIRSVS